LPPPARPANTEGMDQERADYADHPTGRRRPWTLTQVAILLIAIGIAVPVLGTICLFSFWALSPDPGQR
jgi:hypothetical protein